jgi:hypothetical protein
MFSMSDQKELKTIELELTRRREERAAGRGTTRRRLRRLLRAGVIGVALVFFGLSGWFLLNFLRLNSDLIEGHIKQRVLPGLTAGVAPVSVGRITGDLIHGVELQNLVVQNPHFSTGGVFLTVGRITLKYSLIDVFWGNLILEKMIADGVVITLSRNRVGRAVWNFGAPAAAAEAEVPFGSGTVSAAAPVGNRTVPESTGSAPQKVDPQGKAQAQAEAVADRFLSHIEVRNLSLLVPRPRELAADPALVRFLNLPPGNLAFSGLNLLLKKYPHKEFNQHTLTVAAPGNARAADLQWTRQKKNGDYFILASLLGQRLILTVQNLGAAGRGYQIYDERNKNRLNLRFRLAREPVSLVRRLMGVNGNIALENISVLEEILPAKIGLEGALKVVLNSADDQTPALDTEIALLLTKGALRLPGPTVSPSMSATVTSTSTVAATVTSPVTSPSASFAQTAPVLAPSTASGVATAAPSSSAPFVASAVQTAHGAPLAPDPDSAAVGVGDDLALHEITNINLEATLKQRHAVIKHLEMQTGRIFSRHAGEVTFVDVGTYAGTFTSDLGGEKMELTGSVLRLATGVRRIALGAKREAGEVHLQAEQETFLGVNRYRELEVTADIAQGRRVADLVPARLLPPQWGKAWQQWLTRVDLIGPLRAQAVLPSWREPGAGRAELTLRGATIVSMVDAADRAQLDGVIRLASRTIELIDLAVTVDRLRFRLDGNVKADAALKVPEAYRLKLVGELVGGRTLTMTAKKWQNTFGLANKPGFDQIELEGGTLFEGLVSTDGASQTFRVAADKVRIRRGKKAWWLDGVTGEISTLERLDQCRGVPARLDVQLQAGVFGFPVQAAGRLNLASATIQQGRITAKGSDFQVLLNALKEHPDVAAMLRQRPLSLSGAFQLDLGLEGRLNRPALTGRLDFPALTVKTGDVTARLPFDLSLKSTTVGEYQGELAAKNAQITIKDTTFALGKTRAALSWSKPKGAKEHLLVLDSSAEVAGTTLTAKARYLPRIDRLESALVRAKSADIQRFAVELAKVGRFRTPFTLRGGFEAEVRLAGPLTALQPEGHLDVEDVTLKFPLSGSRKSLDVENLKGRFEFAATAASAASAASSASTASTASIASTAGAILGEIKQVTGRILGAQVILDGKARLEKGAQGFVPVLERVHADIRGLPAANLFGFFQGGVMAPELLAPFSGVTGLLSGKLAVTGARGRYLGEGELALAEGGFAHTALKEPLKSLSGRLRLARKKEGEVPRLEVAGLTGSFGRSRISIPSGFISDPQKAARFEFKGVVDSVYPSDVLSLLGGLRLPRISFPRESPLRGTLQLSGTPVKPLVTAAIEGTDTEVKLQSGTATYLIPFGKTSVNLTYDTASGLLQVPESTVGIMDGSLKISKGEGVFASGRVRSFTCTGTLAEIDLAYLGQSGQAPIRGRAWGNLQAEQKENGTREALFQLQLKDFVVMNMPLDPDIIAQIGLESLEEPEFRTGQLHLYIASDDETGDVGKLKIADGLLAGPDLRFEITSGLFDPKNLQLNARLQLNPQPLRQSKLGKKMGNLTRVLQDKETGIPYIDLKVTGTWDNPGLMKSAIVKQNEKRGKRNYIKSIFGGRRSHKASVEELKAWFPGWTPTK